MFPNKELPLPLGLGVCGLAGDKRGPTMGLLNARELLGALAGAQGQCHVWIFLARARGQCHVWIFWLGPEANDMCGFFWPGPGANVMYGFLFGLGPEAGVMYGFLFGSVK